MEGYRIGGQRLCHNKAIRTDRLDATVWDDVSSLLSEPERIRAEYQRRLEGPEVGESRELGQLTKLMKQVKKSISRLIDAYGDGLVDKSEFEPRIVAARERRSKLEEEHKRKSDEPHTEEELRLVIGQLEEFSHRVSDGLQGSDWVTRREIIRALVKRVEIEEHEVRIVYRVSPSPFENRPQLGISQHCWGRNGCVIRHMRSSHIHLAEAGFPRKCGRLDHIDYLVVVDSIRFPWRKTHRERSPI